MFKLFKNIFFVFLFVLLSACNQENNVSSVVSEQTHQPAMMYAGKQHAPVDVRYNRNSKFMVGQAAEVSVVFINHKDTEVLIVKQIMDEGLMSQESSQEYRFGPLIAGAETELVFHFMPQSEGLFYIRLTAILVSNESQQARGFAIPVEVGDQLSHKPSRSPGIPGVDSTGQGIISMPARESSE